MTSLFLKTGFLILLSTTLALAQGARLAKVADGHSITEASDEAGNSEAAIAKDNTACYAKCDDQKDACIDRCPQDYVDWLQCAGRCAIVELDCRHDCRTK